MSILQSFKIRSVKFDPQTWAILRPEDNNKKIQQYLNIIYHITESNFTPTLKWENVLNEDNTHCWLNSWHVCELSQRQDSNQEYGTCNWEVLGQGVESTWNRWHCSHTILWGTSTWSPIRLCSFFQMQFSRFRKSRELQVRSHAIIDYIRLLTKIKNWVETDTTQGHIFSWAA